MGTYQPVVAPPHQPGARGAIVAALLAAAVSACTVDMGEELPDGIDLPEPGDGDDPAPDPGPDPGPDFEAGWSWILDTDHGVRGDGAGLGYFLAPRTHGKHNGLDILGAVGEPLYAPCAGQVATGVSSSFGKWAKLVCPLPDRIAGDAPLHASIFFAHMHDIDAALGGGWQAIRQQTRLGTVGRTGNAGSSNPHVHLEIIIHGSEADALGEGHAGSDQSDTVAADDALLALDDDCMGPHGLDAMMGVRRARRVDPFVILTCLGAAKPPVEQPPGSLQATFYPWSTYYSADTFDVDRGTLAIDLAAMAVTWTRKAGGGYELRARGHDAVAEVAFYVDGFPLAPAAADGDEFVSQYTFTQQSQERYLEARGFDASGAPIALGIGLIDVTADTAAFVRQVDVGHYDIGLERTDAASIEVRIDGAPLIDEVSDSTRSERGEIRYRFKELGTRDFEIIAYDASGQPIETFRRSFRFR